jgi:hypothetical protein
VFLFVFEGNRYEGVHNTTALPNLVRNNELPNPDSFYGHKMKAHIITLMRTKEHLKQDLILKCDSHILLSSDSETEYNEDIVAGGDNINVSGS